MKLHLLICTTIFLVCGCSTATYTQSTPKATKAEIDSAWASNYRCLAYNSNQLDDNRSSVDVIAKAVVSSCSQQTSYFYNTLTRGSGPFDSAKVYDAVESKSYNTALQVLLKNRATK